YSTLIVLFWKQEADELGRVLDEKLPAVHTVLTFAMDRYVRLLDRRQQLAKPQPILTGPERVLSDKEREVLTWIGRGLTASGAADKMNVALTTVRSHIRSTLHKLNASNVTHAVAIASSSDLLDF
ncbi:MAG: hypothetical protein GC150_05110, partial [Rhizobiales bacterium]|nr:hypothetical protein [Hyphomicrobiales bacterium]